MGPVTIGGGGEFAGSGGTLDALPMPLGSLSALGLAGPNGTPLIAELPAPADPAGGVSCAYARAGATKLPSSRTSTSGELRDIESFQGRRSNDYVGCRFPVASVLRTSASGSKAPA
jgi:hypothetical protein